MNIKFRFGQRMAIFITVITSLILSIPMASAYSDSDLKKLLTTNECNQCDLSGADLSNKDLYGSALIETNLSRANLTNTLLREAKLNGANLTKATLHKSFFNGATLTGANFTDANLEGANFNNARLDGANFTRANISNANFTSAIMSCTDKADKSTCVKLIDVVGQSTILNSAILSGADLSDANFSQAKMRITNLESATLTRTRLCKTDLTGAEMPNSTIYNGNVVQFGANDSCKTAKSAHVVPDTAIDYCRGGKPIFPHPENIQLGITPTVWSNSDDLSIDLVPPIPYQQIMSEIALSGFKGTQNAPKFPKDMDELLSALTLRNITISEPWVGTFFTIGAADESQKTFKNQFEFMQTIGGNVIVVAEMGGAVHQQPIAPLPNRPKLTDKQWTQLLNGLNDIGKQAFDAGMKLVYHHHVGTGVETMQDIDRLMAGTNPKYLHLLLDTGHAYYAGVDPLTLTNKYLSRIAHVHLKNIRQKVLDQSIAQGKSFLDSVRAGVFTVPGDKIGAINFDPILKKLASADFQGWLIVEAEQDPNKANPLKYALMARQYLCDFAGL